MELPIQLKFFRKIELYQEYKSIENNPSKDLTWSEAWNIEKAILMWMPENHWHIGDYLGYERIKKDILKADPPRFSQAITNLITRGFAENPDKVSAIKITKEGFLMAEVINDIDGRKFNRYFLFNALVWLTVWSGIVIVVANAIKVLFDL